MSHSQVSGHPGASTPESPSLGLSVIRQASARDAAVLHEVAAETFPLACPPHTTQEAIADFIATSLSEAAFDAYLADPQRQLFVAEQGGEVAGYTMLVFGEPTDPDVAAAVTTRPTVELSKVYVRETHHGSGLAAQLVDASVEASISRGAHSIWLGVNQENVRANRFYEKRGFAQMGTKKFLVGDRYEDDFVRERLLFQE
ncbi:MAG: GNAT family N-acetyltransferase [Rhodoglobus sp.]